MAAAANQPTQNGSASRARESSTARELGKLKVVQKVAELYRGTVDLCSVTQGMSNTVEFLSGCVVSTVMDSGIGQKADQVFVAVARKAKYVETVFVSWTKSVKSIGKGAQNDTQPKGDQESSPEENGSFLARMLTFMFHMYFRFFPLCVAFRWSVHWAFLVSQALLSLCIDLARPDMTKTKTVEALPAEEAANKESSSAPREARTTKSSFLESWWQELTDGIYAVFYLFDVFFFIPYLTYQTYFLDFLDDLLYSLAGLNETKEDFKDRLVVERQIKAPEKLSSRKWVVDAAIDQGVGQALRFPVLGLFLSLFGVSRPVHPFQTIAYRIQKECSGLVSYLKDDPNYDESKDPDYCPSDASSEDSLEYKDDAELDPDVTIETPHVNTRSDQETHNPDQNQDNQHHEHEHHEQEHHHHD